MPNSFSSPALEESSLHIHHRRFPRPKDKLIGAGQTLAVEQGIDFHGASLLGGALQPEFSESRKLFPGGKPGIDGQSPSRQAKHLMLRHRPKIAGSSEDHHMVVVVLLIERIGKPEARKAEIRWNFVAKLISAVGELPGRKRHPTNPLRVESVDGDRVSIVEARMDELDLEITRAFSPKGLLRIETDISVVVVTKLLEKIGNRLGRFEGLSGQLLG